METKLSKITLGAYGILAVIGLSYGLFLYLHRPASYPPNNTANNAILTHWVLAACLLATIISTQLYRTKRHQPTIWLAPFSNHAFQRFKTTIIPQRFSFTDLLRALLSILLLALVLWPPFRSAMQITAALDPSVTANAWGGPSYVGATLAHWMDDAIMLYIGAGLLHIVMKRL